MFVFHPRIWARSAACGLLLLMAAAAAVKAETPTMVADEVSGDGIYVASGISGIDATALTPTIERAQRLGVRLIVVAPVDPQPDAESFSLRVRQAADVEAALLFAPDGSVWASVVEDYDDGFVRAIVAARAAEDPEEAADVFLTELVTEPDRPLPDVIRTVIQTVIILLLALGLAVVAEQLLRRRREVTT